MQSTVARVIVMATPPFYCLDDLMRKKNTFVVFFMNLFCIFSWAGINLEVGSTLHRFSSLAWCLPLVRDSLACCPGLLR